MKTDSKEYKEAVRIGEALIGKTAQSRLLCELNEKGNKVISAPQKITGYEIVESFQEPCVMAIFEGGVSIFEDCIFNIQEQSYALIEQGKIHTNDLSLEEAKEMQERHSRIFPDLRWDIAPMSEVENVERLKGYLERQREIAVKYHSV